MYLQKIVRISSVDNSFISSIGLRSVSPKITSISVLVLFLIYGRSMEQGRSLYFALWFLLSFYLLSIFFPHLISAVADRMSAILPHIVWH